MASLEDMYRRLFVAYPSDYRSEHEEEILTTLLEAAEPGRRWPSLREARGLLVGGLRTRAMTATRQGERTLWADGLRLGVALLLVWTLSTALPLSENWSNYAHPLEGQGWVLIGHQLAVPLMYLLALVAVLRGATRSAVALVLVAGIGGVVLGAVGEDLPSTTYALQQLLGWQTLLTSFLPIILLAGALLGQTSMQPDRRPWSWWAVAAMIALPVLEHWSWGWSYGWVSIEAQVYITTVLIAVPALVLVAFAIVARDPRPSIAAALFAAGWLLPNTYGWLFDPWPAGGTVIAPPSNTVSPLLLVVSLATTVVTMRASGRRLVRR